MSRDHRITPAVEHTLAAAAAELRILGYGVDEPLVGVIAPGAVFVTHREIAVDLLTSVLALSPAFGRHGDVLEALGLTRCGDLAVLVISGRAPVRVERLRAMPWTQKGGSA